MDRLKFARLFTSCFGLGYLPVAPGTWGSLPVVLLFALLCWFNVPAVIVTVVMVFVAIDASTLCVVFSPVVAEALGRKDPGEVVIDEVAGQAVVFMWIYAAGATSILVTAGAGFVLFRVFDILKPWPCKRLENLPDGWGVVADDLMAGVYAAVVLQIITRFVF